MDIRPSPIAGTWYPADPARLRAIIARYLDEAHPAPLHGKLWGLLAPHAGIDYSGPVAAWAFALARGLTPEIVAIIAPWHRAAREPLLTSAHDAYATPLGRIDIDRGALNRLDAILSQQFGYHLARCRNDDEHAVEIELPFLQYVLPPFRLLPIMLGDQSAPVARALGLALANTLRNSSALLVASSDLSHYQRPEAASRMDAAFLRRVMQCDPEAVLAAEAEGDGYACGSGAIAAMLWACRSLGADRVTVVRQGSSGDREALPPWVVGYGAAAVWQSE